MIEGKLDEREFESLITELNLSKSPFITGESYPDEQTISLLTTYCKYSGSTVDDALESFGKYWIQQVGASKYANILKAGGDTLSEFLVNLPFLHGKVLMLFHNIEPPSFIVETLNVDTFLVTYTSERSGLGQLAKGMFLGLADHYNETIDIVLLNNSEDMSIYTFKIKLLMKG